ncbi:hypothetical protein [Rhodopirellula sp. MGV]|uniref:hypothetical protein n=1 Tax=Rhodopirellula sp. MGV TaxID=2023130 RepID=UPI000B960504|nr:hypothetical protein [Rhodopirellula sp. MGV]PNY36773.1 hypothetical protein C2E31_11225 [Rhodopirellula baltica]
MQMQGVPGDRGRVKWSLLPVTIIVFHLCLVSIIAFRSGFAWTEVGLLPSGVADWKYADFASFRVNPPLVRDIAALPWWIGGPQLKYLHEKSDPRYRMEWDLAREMIIDHEEQSYWWLALGRIACLPFLAIGMATAFIWSSRLYGHAAGIGVLLLWAVSPSLIGYGALISGDAQAACMALGLLFVFRQWLDHRSLVMSTALGLMAAFAVLTKTSLAILVLMLPLFWLAAMACDWLKRSGPVQRRSISERLNDNKGVLGHVIAASFAFLLVINLMYGFDGSFRPLGNFDFISRSFAGADGWQEVEWSGNRFRGTILEQIPVPLPSDLLIGLDLQKWDFDRVRWSYANGDWADHGWWWYYLLGFATKSQLGLLALIPLAIWIRFRDGIHPATVLRDESLLMSSAILLIILASTQTGVSRHLRYVLPAVPLFLVLLSRAFNAYATASQALKGYASICLSGMIASSLWVYPHSISYFNESIGGPMHADKVFNASNIDWGQDYPYLKRWSEDHSGARPLLVKSYLHLIDPQKVGIPTGRQRVPPMTVKHYEQHGDASFPVGWYAIDRETRLRRTGDYLYLHQLNPVAFAGYGFLIYEITEDDSHRLLRAIKKLAKQAERPQDGDDTTRSEGV